MIKKAVYDSGPATHLIDRGLHSHSALIRAFTEIHVAHKNFANAILGDDKPGDGSSPRSPDIVKNTAGKNAKTSVQKPHQ